MAAVTRTTNLSREGREPNPRGLRASKAMHTALPAKKRRGLAAFDSAHQCVRNSRFVRVLPPSALIAEQHAGSRALLADTKLLSAALCLTAFLSWWLVWMKSARAWMEYLAGAAGSLILILIV